MLADALKAMGWAVCAAALALGVAVLGLGHGLLPPALPLVAAPLAAYRFHRSPRIGWFVFGWLLLLLGVAALFVWWELRDFHFRIV